MKLRAVIRHRTPSITAVGAIAAALLFLLPSCDPDALFDRPVPPFGETDELVVLVRNGPATRFLGADGKYSGIEQDLLDLFAKDTGMRLRLVERTKFSEILPALRRHLAHLAAAGLTATEERRRQFIFGPAYLSVHTVVAYNTEHSHPRNVHDLVGKRVAVVAGSSGAEQLALEAQEEPRLRWEEIPAADSIELLDRLASDEVDYVVTDSNIVELAQNFSSNIGRAFNLGEPETLAWALAKDASPLLVDRVNNFFARINANGTLRILLDRYYGHIQRLTQADVSAFLERRLSVLPQYRGIFQEAQELTGIDWRLLAALGFQESHWNPMATSPTGVRGLMMLTSETSDRLGVDNRLDPHQNIVAGARYLKILKDTLPERITEPDRTWLALASYNVGYGHLEDARILTQRQGLNADTWIDVKKTLPLLTRSDFYITVKRGFARGGEAVILTENIRNYFDILVRYEESYRPLFPTLPEETSQVLP
ncbi:MAG TPA: membrane-bound lytic murein transglycosylase MltF [Burkholderiales bacterium]|nr:membrane-bound lytic murein transglycosylase MltF [Burkholderiales bacterium]